jgi:site-specific recombinase XerD
MNPDLEPISTEEAVELYLTEKRPEFAQATLRSHRSRLRHFIRWCDTENISNLNSLTGRDLHRYRLWRREDGDLALASEKLRWIQFGCSFDGLSQWLQFGPIYLRRWSHPH